jgi:hypothetical protein
MNPARYALLDYYLRSIVTGILALGIVAVAGWQELRGTGVSGEFRDWAGLIVGVYFGSHVAFNGSAARSAANAANAQTPTPPDATP